MDAYVNLATSTVATAPSPATSGTSLVVAAGTGTRYPAVPFDVTLYAPGTKPDPTNAEIARCTAVSTDTLTLTRAQYGTTAQPVAVGWYVDNDVTANFIGEMVALIPSPASTVVGPDSFGASAVVGTGTTFARADHDHGLPAAPADIPLSTVTTAGDLIVASGAGAVTRLGVGSAGQVLEVVGSSPAWTTPSGGGALATAREVAIGTSSTNVVTYTPSAAGNFVLGIYFRVITATTNVTVTVTWTDATGAQTLTVLSAVPEVVGSYSLTTFMVDSTAAAITVAMTAGTASQVYGSATILQG